jgi:quinol monooxygenase YgiN
MPTKALLVRLEAKIDRDDDVQDFLRSALPLVREEPRTRAWYAIRFGRGEYGIFDVFPDEAARDAHLAGAVASALTQRADELLAAAPAIQKIDVLAHKLPAGASVEASAKGLLLVLEGKAGHDVEITRFLRSAQPLVLQEAKTTAWFALRLDGEHYGIFDVFPDNGGRFAHLTGQVPRELAKHALSLLGSIPDIGMFDVLAEHYAA